MQSVIGAKILSIVEIQGVNNIILDNGLTILVSAIGYDADLQFDIVDSTQNIIDSQQYFSERINNKIEEYINYRTQKLIEQSSIDQIIADKIVEGLRKEIGEAGELIFVLRTEETNDLLNK